MTSAAVETPLSDEISAFKAKFMADAPKGLAELFGAKTKELAETGIVESAIKVGDQAPEFTLPDGTGKEVSTAELLKNGPIVLTFYRGSWCPYCNLTLAKYQEYLPQFKAKGATFVAVSPEKPEFIEDKVKAANLEFPVLSDVGMKVGSQFGIKFVLAPELQEVYNQFKLDVNKHNGDNTFQLPLPATYVIGKDGKVVYSFVDVDYTKRAEPADVLAAIP